jgi:3',5'-cyclic AMP phosphodiesterase CpdA
MTRRTLLHIAACAPFVPVASAQSNSFRFIHFTDVHIQPELRAADGSRACFQKINKSGADFAICGGDLVFDAAAQERPRAQMLFDLYRDTVKEIEMPVHTVVGNHDVFGTETRGGLKSDPEYGKKMFEDRVGKRYYSLVHKGWHFIVLDSIHITESGSFIGRVDDEQLDWLLGEVARIDKHAPVVVITHIPLVSGVLQIVPDPWAKAETYLVTNSRQVLEILAPLNLKAVLQGHTHIRETVLYNGCQFITSGAVCGNWWKGPRLGHPEGFAVLTVDGNDIRWQYETYGFVAVG